MKMKVSDYIAKFLTEHGISTIFTVVGGGAMHLNDSFGHHDKLQCVYNHHEQACAIASEAYARIDGKLAVCCVTSGPGAVNALNGVAGAYLDSIPMLVISGQTKSTMTVRYSGLNLRTLGNQEFDIIGAVSGMTKYAEMIMDPNHIRYCLERAISLAESGRPGPCWLDIPLDIQGMIIETESLIGYTDSVTKEIDNQAIAEIISRLKIAKRPVIYAGNGIRIAKAFKEFDTLVQKLQIPVVTCWDSIDLIETDNDFYAGRGGTMGDRGGNFAVQNSDLLIVIGSRLNIYQVGYDVKTWARAAYIVMVDIDSEEMKKPTIRVDLPVCMDAKVFLKELEQQLNKYIPIHEEWVLQCQLWKKEYPVVLPRHFASKDYVNVYAFMDVLSKSLKENAISVVANGSASVVGSQSYYIKRQDRFIMNCGLSSMGYDLPAAIGASIGAGEEEVICIAGDGSIQMNIQELQTIVTNNLPIRIFVICNGGYHQIRQTQNNVFGNKLIGVGPESGDLGFPDFEKLSFAYGIPYYRCERNTDLNEVVKEMLAHKGYALCEVVTSTSQIFEPKSATKRLEDGSLFSPPLEDLAPFLPREELEKNMYIPIIE